MEIIRRAPMLGVLFSLVCSLAVYDRLGVWAFVLGVPLFFTGILFCSYENDLPSQWKFFACSLIIALLCSVRIYSVVSQPPLKPYILRDVTGTVESVRTWGKRTYAAVIGTEHDGKFIAMLPFMTLTEGTRIKFTGPVTPLRAARPGSDFSEFRYWASRGVKGRVKLSYMQELPEKFSIHLMRYKLSRLLSIYMPELTARYLKAAWLGERVNLLTDSHKKWGTVHLLAVSGFHVAIVIFCAVFLFGQRNILLLSIILWGYILMTGAAPSAMRAGLMIQTGLLARLLGRPVNTLNSVSFAGVLLLLYSPFYFWDIGWRLSMLAVITITSGWLLVSPAVFIATFPQVSYTFGSVPLVGIVLNLFAPLYFSFAFVLASAGAFMRLLNFPLSKYIMLSCEGIFIVWEYIANFFLNLIPFVFTWNNFLAWLSTGMFIMIICNYFRFSLIRSFILASAGSLLAFVVFML
ncbi:MAG: ComEC/Rec2 family competence protein [Synergistaceae bacterium]|nr:ComEC/Rec2 family competence protein [Synergistaceae bacterium]